MRVTITICGISWLPLTISWIARQDKYCVWKGSFDDVDNHDRRLPINEKAAVIVCSAISSALYPFSYYFGTTGDFDRDCSSSWHAKVWQVGVLKPCIQTNRPAWLLTIFGGLYILSGALVDLLLYFPAGTISPAPKSLLTLTGRHGPRNRKSSVHDRAIMVLNDKLDSLQDCIRMESKLSSVDK